MTWLIVIIVAGVVCGIIGFLASDDGEKGEGALSGCLGGSMGCGYIVFQILMALLGLFLLFKLGSWLFG